MLASLPVRLLLFATLINVGWTTELVSQQGWKAGPDAATARNSAAGTIFGCPFVKADRVYWDQIVDVDLSGLSSVELSVDVANAQAFRRLSVHFKSGGGWYSGLTPVLQSGRQRYFFPLGGMDIEGNVAGWKRITAVRVSGWKGEAVNSEFRLFGLTGHRDAITMYQATTSERSSAERSVARRSTQRISKWLLDLHITHGIVRDEDFRADSLRYTKVLILPYNRTPSKTALEAIRAFQRGGGKTIGFHDGPSSVTGHVGAKILPMVSTKKAGTFNAFRLSLADPFPERAYQHVWNVLPLAATNGGRIVGRWEDSRQQTGSVGAMVRSPNGFWFGQVFRDGDAAGKQQLLLAMLGDLYPPVWRSAAAGKLERSTRKFGQNSLGGVIRELRTASGGSPQLAQLISFIPKLEDRARTHLGAGSYRDAYDTAKKLEDSIDRVWASSQTSRAGEMRAVWEPNGTGLIIGDWDHTCRRLSQHGFNTLFPNMLWAGKSHAASTILPASGTRSLYGDQLRPCLQAAKRHGISVHVWKICWSLDTAPASFRWKIKSAGRMAQNRDGTTKAWLCPSHPANRKMELDSILELARNYEVDGIHLDYLRYTGRSTCYAPATRSAFETWRRAKVKTWPPAVGDSQFETFRAEQITTFLAEVRRELRQIKPNVQLSVAVWPSYPQVIPSIGQDYGAWLKQDLVDFLTPMNYTSDPAEFRRWCQTQSGLQGGRGKIVPGIAAIANEAELSAAEIIQQVRISRELGLPGFALFKLDHVVAENVFPQLSAGLTKP